MNNNFPFLLLLAILAPSVFAAPPSVIDDRGRQVTLLQPAHRVIVLGPSMTELVFAIGAGPRVIAVDNASDYPAAAKALPRVGSVGMLDIERISALRPDLLVVWDSGYASTALGRLERQTALYYAEPRRLDDIPITLRKLAELTGQAATAAVIERDFNQKLSTLQSAYATRTPLRGFYQVWQSPLMTIGNRHVIHDVMQLCGVENIFADSDLTVPRVDTETVMWRRPQIIITGSYQPDTAAMAYWQQWLGQTGFVLVSINPDLFARPTPRILDGAKQLCEFAEKQRNR